MRNTTLARVCLIFTPAKALILSNVFFLIYSHDEKDEKFVCELFIETIDIKTREDDCDDSKDRKDGKKDQKDGRKGGKDGKKY